MLFSPCLHPPTSQPVLCTDLESPYIASNTGCPRGKLERSAQSVTIYMPSGDSPWYLHGLLRCTPEVPNARASHHLDCGSPYCIFTVRELTTYADKGYLHLENQMYIHSSKEPCAYTSRIFDPHFCQPTAFYYTTKALCSLWNPFT